jgi:hypothetical protein
MNPLTFAMAGILIGLWVNAFALLGIDAKPAKEGAVSPIKTVAMSGSLLAVVSLLPAAIWFFAGEPFGADEPVNVLFAGIVGTFALIWIGVFAQQWFDLDGRPVGNMCLLCAIMLIIFMIGIARILRVVGVHVWLVQLGMATFVVLLLLFWGLYYGKVSPRLAGWWTLVCCISVAYFLWFGGGIFPVP